MWKRPSIQKPDFLSDLPERECLEINGGYSVFDIFIHTQLGGTVVPPFPLILITTSNDSQTNKK